MSDDIAILFEEIHKLLKAPTGGADAPPLAEVEHALTTGYARALALEAERWRLERRIGEAAAFVERDANGPRELAKLATRLQTADRELTRLRALLSTLRDRASALRVAEASA